MTVSLWVYAWVLPCAIAYLVLSWVRRWIKIDHLEKRHILITGADTGFGSLLTQRLDMVGCRLYAACESEAAKSRLQQFTSTRCKALVMDPTVDEEVRQAVDLVKQSLPENEGLWGLVNNASTYGRAVGPLEWLTHNDFKRVMDSGALGTLRVTLAFLPLIKKAKGRIVSLGSVAGRLASPVALPYSMSMAALENFSDGLRVYMAQYDVSVHLVEPVLFRVDPAEKLRVNKAVDAAWKGAPWYIKEEFGEDYYKELLETVGRLASLESSAPHLNKVVKAYSHALTARCPRTRYSVGWDACLFAVPLSYMPSLVTDYLISRSHIPKSPVS